MQEHRRQLHRVRKFGDHHRSDSSVDSSTTTRPLQHQLQKPLQNLDGHYAARELLLVHGDFRQESRLQQE